MKELEEINKADPEALPTTILVLHLIEKIAREIQFASHLVEPRVDRLELFRTLLAPWTDGDWQEVKTRVEELSNSTWNVDS